MTISIQGDWGSGKSSMMYLIEQKIKAYCQAQSKKLHTLWFNTWQFSQFNLDKQLSISLLSRFINNLEKLKPDQSADESVKKPPEDSKLKKTVRKLAFWTVANAAGLVRLKLLIRSWTLHRLLPLGDKPKESIPVACGGWAETLAAVFLITIKSHLSKCFPVMLKRVLKEFLVIK